MRIADLIPPGGNVFIRSEWNLIGPSWPCTAFTRLADLRELQSEYVKDRDIMLAIGTTNPERTRNPYHRGRLLTVYTIWPGLYRATKDLVPPESWEHNVLTRGADKWAHGVPARRIFQLRRKAPWPDAHDICPLTYHALGPLSPRLWSSHHGEGPGRTRGNPRTAGRLRGLLHPAPGNLRLRSALDARLMIRARGFAAVYEGEKIHAAFIFGFSQPRLTSTSAICTAFSAAPLRKLSDTTQRLRPFSIVGSSRMRLM